MVVKIAGVKPGRPDYTIHVERTAIPTYKVEQEPFYFTDEANMSPNGSYYRTILTVPSGKRFIFHDGIVSGDANVLLQVVFSFTPSTGPMNEIWKWTYQLVHIHAPAGIVLESGGTVGITIYNWSSTTIKVFTTVLGMLEKVV